MQLTQSVKETALALGLGRTSVYSLINQGRLETIKVGSRTLIKTSSILALIGENEVAK